MGKILDSWLQRNSQLLATLAPGAGVRAPVAAPNLWDQPTADVRQSGFGPIAPAQRSNFEQIGVAPPGAGIQDIQPVGTAPRGSGMSDIEPIGTAPSSFEPRTPRAVQVQPVDPERARVTPPPGAPEGKPYGLKDMLAEMSDEELENATSLLNATGTTPQQAYQQITGNPPPKDMKKRDLSEFLLEFGLGLLAAPAGTSDVEAFGRAGMGAYQGHRQRVATRAEQERAAEQEAYERAQTERTYRDDQIDKSFNRQAKVAELELRRQEAEVRLGRPANAQYNHYVGDDGYMYTYDEASGQGVRVEVGGKPIKPDPKVTSSGDRKLDFEVKYNMYLDTYGKRPDGSALSGADLQRVQRQALEFANRTNTYTESEAQREAVKGAVDLLSKDTNYLMADPEEKEAMRLALTNELKSLYLGGSGAPTTGEPDPSKLAAGMATPVTGEDGTTVYWTLGDDGRPRKVDPSELE